MLLPPLLSVGVLFIPYSLTDRQTPPGIRSSGLAIVKEVAENRLLVADQVVAAH